MKLAGLLIVTTVTVACGKDSDDSASSAVVQSVVGEWKSACIINDDHTWQKITVLFTDTQNKLSYTVYIDNACVGEVSYFEAERTYTIGESLGVDSTVRKIDYKYTRLTAIAKREDVVAGFNASSFYGYTDWVLGIAKDITGRDGDPQAGETRYSTFKIVGDSLILGSASEESPGTTEATRAYTLDFSTPLIKQ